MLRRSSASGREAQEVDPDVGWAFARLHFIVLSAIDIKTVEEPSSDAFLWLGCSRNTQLRGNHSGYLGNPVSDADIVGRSRQSRKHRQAAPEVCIQRRALAGSALA